MADSDLTSAYLGYAAQMAGATMDYAMQYSSQKWKEKEAKKVREWNEQMYQRQLEDQRENWRMANEYNLPSAALARLRDAGLNPQLYYGQGGQSLFAASPASGADVNSAPAASGSMQTNFGQALQGAALLKAQIDNINADTKQKESQTQGQDIENSINTLTKDIQVAIKYRDYDYLNESIAKMQNEIFNSSQITTQEVLSLMQGREYQIKHYQLDSYVRGQQVLQEWENVATNKTNASANWQNSIANLRSVIIQEKIAPYQIGVMQANAGLMASEAKTNNVLRPFQIYGAKFSNYNQVFDMLTKGANLSKVQADALQSQLDAVKKSMGLDSYLGGIIAPFVMMTGGSAGKHGQIYRDQKNSFEKYKLNY